MPRDTSGFLLSCRGLQLLWSAGGESTRLAASKSTLASRQAYRKVAGCLVGRH
jgi:hypothetical protein